MALFIDKKMSRRGLDYSINKLKKGSGGNLRVHYVDKVRVVVSSPEYMKK